jgi:hypothetical protein
MNAGTRTLHRTLDTAHGEAVARDGPDAPAPDSVRGQRWRTDSGISGGPEPRVLLLRLAERTSARGTKYLSGLLGLASVVAFEAREPDKFGQRAWDVFVSPQRPKGGGNT